MGYYEGLEFNELLEDESIDFESDGEAQYAIAMCYLKGKGVEKNEELGNQWLEKAKKNGYKVENKIEKTDTYNSNKQQKYEELGQYELYKMMEKGDEKAALYYARIALKKGEFQECIRVLEQMEKQWNVRKTSWLREKWELCGTAGIKIQDIKYAKTCYKNALELGNKSAENLLLNCYDDLGIIEESDFSLISKLAGRGKAKACFMLGTIYMQGDITEASNMKAIVYFNKALVCSDVDEIVAAKCRYQLSQLSAADLNGSIPRKEEYIDGIKKGAKAGDSFCAQILEMENDKKANVCREIAITVGLYALVLGLFGFMNGLCGDIYRNYYLHGYSGVNIDRFQVRCFAGIGIIISIIILVGVVYYIYLKIEAAKDNCKKIDWKLVLADFGLVALTIICTFCLFGGLEGIVEALKNGIVIIVIVICIIAVLNSL